MTIEEIHENDMKHHRDYLIGAEIDKCDLHDNPYYKGFKSGNIFVTINGREEWHYFLAVKVNGYEEVQRELKECEDEQVK